MNVETRISMFASDDMNIDGPRFAKFDNDAKAAAMYISEFMTLVFVIADCKESV